MAQISLTWMLRRKNGLAELLLQTMQYTKGQLCVEAANGELLLGTAQPKDAPCRPILLEQATAGWVSGTPAAAVEYLAQLLQRLLEQEAHKKKLGSELLHQYREINLIYTFSEQLASALSVDAIAALILQEAGQVIRFSSGVVACFEVPSQAIQLKARMGSDFPDLPDWQDEGGFFRETARNGKSEIIPFPAADLSEKGASFMLYASLRVRDRVLGAVLLSGSAAQEFSAADLKLLTTLAFQAAAAMESALLHEQAKEKALQSQREQLMYDFALKHPFFKKTLSVIQANLDNPDFSVERLSKALNLSTSQLQRKTVALVRRTPVQLIHDLRLQKAKALLRRPDLTVAEVAFQTGFLDPSYFTRLFVRETGMTPSAWKASK